MATNITIPQDVLVQQDGSSYQWVRLIEDSERKAYLDFRGENQSLPRGSSPLFAFGGRVICGQHFLIEEVEAYIASNHLDRESVCVFEFER